MRISDWSSDVCSSDLSAARLAASRRRIAALEGRIGKAASPELFALGHGGMDSCLGGGLARGRLHEIFAKEIEDAASASGYALMLAQRDRKSTRLNSSH